MGFRVVRAVMLLLFIFSALVQWNDPDALRWTLLYMFAACTCLADRPARLWLQVAHLMLLSVLLVIAITGVVMLANDLLTGVNRLSSGLPVAMANLTEERSREAGGLLIVGLWSFALIVRFLHTRLMGKQYTPRPENHQATDG